MHKEAHILLSAGQNTTTSAYATIRSTEALLALIRHAMYVESPQTALVTIALAFEAREKTSQHILQSEQSIRYLLEHLRPLVRRTDTVAVLGHRIYFVLPKANLQGGQIVQERLWEALLWTIHNASSSEVLRPLTFTIGHSASIQPEDEITRLIEDAAKTQLSFTLQEEKEPSNIAKQPAVNTDKQPENALPDEARRLGIPYLTLLPRKPSAKILRVLTPQLARELHCYPLGRARDVLTVAMIDPQDHGALDRLQRATGMRIFPVLAHPQELQSALDQFYS